MNTERLKPQELDSHVANGTFRLAFVGMSNGGKSYRSRVLQNELDFFWYEVDAHIQEALNIDDMDDISSWLGYPTMGTYQERQNVYLEAEEKCTHLHNLDTEGKNLVFDTTGSVIYLSEAAKNWLKDECLVVNIDVGEDKVEEMTRRYFEEPKPVVWGDTFKRNEGESDDDALHRCYPDMLRYRLGEYNKLAHLTITHDELHDATGEETLEIIKRHLWYGVGEHQG